jgi:hypothetical protein
MYNSANLSYLNSTVSLLTYFPVGATPPTAVRTLGYRAAGDNGGADYWYNPSDTTSRDNGFSIRVDSANRRWYQIGDNVVPPLTPQDFGAYGDGTAHLITSADITNNPQWIGTYTANTTSWDTVGIQECLYACFASSSTHGSVVWNNTNGTTLKNRRFFCPIGTYYITSTITCVAQGFDIKFETRLSTSWNWYGPLTGTMFYCNAVSYGDIINFTGVFPNATYSSGIPLPIFTGTLVDLDYDGSITPELKTQQLRLINMTLNGGFGPQAYEGLAISKVGGGAAQGDTIVIENIICNNFYKDGVGLYGDNTLAISFIGGDFQNCWTDGIACFGGTYYTYGTHFENQNTFYQFTPCQHQIVNGGADNHIYDNIIGGTCAITDCRSESDVCIVSDSLPTVARNVSAIGATILDNPWGANGRGYYLGTVMYDSTGSLLPFVLVDEGGSGLDWRALGTPLGPSQTVFTDPNSPGYTVNQWAGYTFQFRFSNGFTAAFAIASNTANTITTTQPLGTTYDVQASYKITGTSAATRPNFGSAPASFSTPLQGVGLQFTTTASSNLVSIGSQLSLVFNVGDYVVIPRASQVTAPNGGWTIPCALIAKITNVSHAGNVYTLTLNKNASVSLTDTPGYWGGGIADGTQGMKWMVIDFDAFVGCDLSNPSWQFGRLRSCLPIRNPQLMMAQSISYLRPINTVFGVPGYLGNAPSYFGASTNGYLTLGDQGQQTAYTVNPGLSFIFPNGATPQPVNFTAHTQGYTDEVTIVFTETGGDQQIVWGSIGGVKIQPIRPVLNLNNGGAQWMTKWVWDGGYSNEPGAAVIAGTWRQISETETLSGSGISLTTGVATTVVRIPFGISSNAHGRWSVTVSMGSGQISTMDIQVSNGPTYTIVNKVDTGGISRTFAFSGSNLQITQTSGSTQTIDYWSARHVG